MSMNVGYVPCNYVTTLKKLNGVAKESETVGTTVQPGENPRAFRPTLGRAILAGH